MGRTGIQPEGLTATRRALGEHVIARAWAEFDSIDYVVAQVLAPPPLNREPQFCEEPGCIHEGKPTCYRACDVCGWHPPYCGCV